MNNQLNAPLVVANCFGAFNSRASGLVTMLEGFAAELNAFNTQVRCYSVAGRNSGFTELSITPPNSLMMCPGRKMKGLFWSPKLEQLLKLEIGDIDLFHNHTLWSLPGHYASRLAFANKVPIVISPHGTLEPWSMKNSQFRKRVIWNVFQKKDLERASCIHVSTVHEIKNIRNLGIKTPIAIIPNGISMPSEQNTWSQNKFRHLHPELKDKKIMLFLGRLHEKKGLKPLIRAWQQLTKLAPNWHLLIVGNDDGYKNQLQSLIREFQLSSSVTLKGPVFGDDKTQVMSAVDAFVLPSFAEGFSMAVLDAMSFRLPVILSKSCNFSEIESRNAGFTVEATSNSVFEGLRKMVEIEETERIKMGNRAMQLVKTKYTWNAVSQQMKDLYRWVIDGGDKPQSFDIDLSI